MFNQDELLLINYFKDNNEIFDLPYDQYKYISVLILKSYVIFDNEQDLTNFEQDFTSHDTSEINQYEDDLLSLEDWSEHPFSHFDSEYENSLIESSFNESMQQTALDSRFSNKRLLLEKAKKFSNYQRKKHQKKLEKVLTTFKQKQAKIQKKKQVVCFKKTKENKCYSYKSKITKKKNKSLKSSPQFLNNKNKFEKKQKYKSKKHLETNKISLIAVKVHTNKKRLINYLKQTMSQTQQKTVKLIHEKHNFVDLSQLNMNNTTAKTFQKKFVACLLI